MELPIAEDADVQAMHQFNFIKFSWILEFELRHLLDVEATDARVEVDRLSLGSVKAGFRTHIGQISAFEEGAVREGGWHVLYSIVADETGSDYTLDSNSRPVVRLVGWFEIDIHREHVRIVLVKLNALQKRNYMQVRKSLGIMYT